MQLNNVIPQLLFTTSSPTFAGIILSGLTPNRLCKTDGDNNITSVSNLADWIAGTTNRVTVTDDTDGTITLSGPQDLHTGASPEFIHLTLSGLTSPDEKFVVVSPTGVIGLGVPTTSMIAWDNTTSEMDAIMGFNGIIAREGGGWSEITNNSAVWDAAQPGHANLTSLAGLAYVSASFVKMTAANTFTLDTNTYYKSGDSPSFVSETLSGQLKILEGGSSPTKYSIFQGGDQVADLTYTLPTAYPASTAFLKISSSGVMTTDVSTYLTSYTETDPVVKAINGIVKSNTTTISAAVAGTDYQKGTLTATRVPYARSYGGNPAILTDDEYFTYDTGLAQLNVFSIGLQGDIILGVTGRVQGTYSTSFVDDILTLYYDEFYLGPYYSPDGANVGRKVYYRYGAGNPPDHAITMDGINKYLLIPELRTTMGSTSAPATSALLDLVSTTGTLIVPRMTTTQKSALTAVNGMVLYDVTLGKMQIHEAGTWVNIV